MSPDAGLHAGIHAAEKATGLGTTATIRRGLEPVAAARAYESLRGLRGKVRFSVDLRPCVKIDDRDRLELADCIPPG